MKSLGRWLTGFEQALAIVAISLMSLLPAVDVAARHLHLDSIPGSTVIVQHLTLWVAFLGAALAAASDRLLSLSANTFLSERWARPVRVAVSGLAAGVACWLCQASFEFVQSQRGVEMALGIPKWAAEAIMPVGFLLVAAGAVWYAAPSARLRLAAAAGVLLPVVMGLVHPPEGSGFLWAAVIVLAAASLLGLPIFATLGGIGLVLFWSADLPIASVPVEAYRLVASPVLPSLPLFTLAGYLLVEGGASQRLLRVYSALFGWMPGGLAITTAVACAIFTWAGSGVTILSMGGLMLPMLVKARYPERFSIGLINGCGSLGLLFPPSLPVILYGIYSHTAISTLFVGGFVPGLLMVAMVSAYGVVEGLRHGTSRSGFSFREARGAIWEAKWELALPVLVLVGLFGGLGTLVEAGAITAIYAFVVEWMVSREFRPWRDFPRVAVECVTVVGGVLTIIGVAVGLTNYLVTAQVPELLIAWVQAHIHSKYAFLLLLNIVLLLKGSFMDVFSAIIVLVPLIGPIAQSFGIHPVQLGIIFLSNLELGYLTPPVGINLCLSALRFKQSMTSIYRSTLPFYLILLAGVLLITYIPWFTMAPLSWLGE